ncbi:MAG: EF-P beta-lysylation protein EpmB [Methylococcaceae bacterium]|nr:EF-P beta-lysylation protein EpmB [Methylococcaceae bacterium]MDZ4219187.1 EF-P beta-lysylation protein EpmB [Methylobacter sp.]MDP2394716.1 EF-P beta-lysylation protein EpmB [Methylococcaceae bacterium]MDP3018025.1 EF-P beta-lysylation protein EpmB [Methylococcaceae bacterium]MDP3389666.1 EF-P beta-lysylation protein EpmB [Methylococcaceae bacterium]
MSDQHVEAQHFNKNWQQQLSEAFNSIEDLCHYLHLPIDALPVSNVAATNFPIRVPLSFAACMEKGNPDDPLLKQVLPTQEELIAYPGFNNDPVGDLQATAQTGVIHKYHGRVLLINTGSCAINCRYCFRRNFPYSELQLSKQSELAAINYIRQDRSLSEVILSGGDPLLLSDARLAKLLEQIDDIEHIKRIRVHSRLPIVLPARITDEFIKTLQKSSKQIVMVVHCNHANEINDRVITAFNTLKAHGITLFNQSVLLKDVNDRVDTLCALSEKLFHHGVIPYYLHLLDKAAGTGHFEAPETQAIKLINEVQATLPGYLVPKLVKEVAGQRSKQVVL